MMIPVRREQVSKVAQKMYAARRKVEFPWARIRRRMGSAINAKCCPSVLAETVQRINYFRLRERKEAEGGESGAAALLSI